MQSIFNCLVIALILVSCGTAKESRYSDTSALERPPTLTIIKSPGAPSATDDSAIPKKQEPGLGEAVAMTETTPPQLKIKQPLDKAWNTINQAIKLNDIKITDHERDKGHIYVSYHSNGLFDQMAALLKDGKNDAIYLLLIEDNGAETTITATMTHSTEQRVSSANQNDHDEQTADVSEELLETLYKTIRDDLVEE